MRDPVDAVMCSLASLPPIPHVLSVLLCAGFDFLVFSLCCCPGLTFGVTPSSRFMTLASRVTSLGFLHKPQSSQEARKPQRSLRSTSNSYRS